MTVGFDNLAIHNNLLLSLPLAEGDGIITHDVSKVRHEDIDLINTPAWSTLASGRTVLQLNGTTQYAECAAADTADLDFTTGDYSITGWIYKDHAILSNLLIGRYGVDLDGWEVYLDDSIADYLQLRHHHVSLTPDDRDGCYSTGWTAATWWFLAITRSGLYPKHYRDGVEVEVTYDTGGLKDPDSCNRDLVIGVRYTKNTNYWPGMLWNLNVWDRELSALDVRFLFNRDKGWFGK